MRKRYGRNPGSICAGPLLSGVLLICAVAACSPGGSVGDITARWEAETSTQDNVTTVRTLTGSVWRGEARLDEEASIGQLEGEDAYVLGNVSGLALGDGMIYILDRQVPVVRVYDLNGRFIRDVGREGSGPGEYRQPESIAVHPHDGRLFVRTPQNARINIYSSDGVYLEQWPLRSGFNTSNPFVMTDSGDLYTFIITNLGRADVTEWKGGMMKCGPADAVSDTIDAPEFDFEPWTIEGRSENSSTVNGVPFAPGVSWAMVPDRSVVGGVSDVYRFEIRHIDGRIIRVERAYEPVSVAPEEARWHRDAATANMVNMFPGWVWNGPDIPPHKPAFSLLLPDADGRIWVVRPGPGVRQEGGVEDPFTDHGWFRNPLWVDTYMMDVFDRDGRFLGSVDLPAGFRFSPRPVFAHDTVIAYLENAEGTPYVKKFRLVLP